MAVPTWRIQIQKQLVSESWSNDYLTDDATIEDAQDLANELLTFERHCHMELVNFVYIRISSYVKGDRTFRHLTVNLPGLDATADYLPLFNTIRMDIGTADSDPARKYYRMPVAEGYQVDGVLTPTFITSFTGIINTYFITPGLPAHIVTNAGNVGINAVPYPRVQMRQLHRRRRKKITP